MSRKIYQQDKYTRIPQVTLPGTLGAPEIEYKVQPLDCCGSIIYRICERQNSDRWLKTLGQPDFDRQGGCRSCRPSPSPGKISMKGFTLKVGTERAGIFFPNFLPPIFERSCPWGPPVSPIVARGSTRQGNPLGVGLRPILDRSLTLARASSEAAHLTSRRRGETHDALAAYVEDL